MREEKADLRGKVYILEKEKRSLELTISSQNAQEVAMKTHIQHLQDELENQESLVRISLHKSILMNVFYCKNVSNAFRSYIHLRFCWLGSSFTV